MVTVPWLLFCRQLSRQTEEDEELVERVFICLADNREIRETLAGTILRDYCISETLTRFAKQYLDIGIVNLALPTRQLGSLSPSSYNSVQNDLTFIAT